MSKCEIRISLPYESVDLLRDLAAQERRPVWSMVDYMINNWTRLTSAPQINPVNAPQDPAPTRTPTAPRASKRPKYHPALWSGKGKPPKKVVERQEMLDELGDVPESVIMEHINAWRRGDEMLAEMLGNLNQY